MSEQNILNPIVPGAADLSLSYGFKLSQQSTITRFRPRQGSSSARRLAAGGHAFQCVWKGLSRAAVTALQQWEAQYEESFFSLRDPELPTDATRYYSGYFDGPLEFVPSGYEQWDANGVFLEEPGRPLYAYPADWEHWAIFIEERRSDGSSLVKLTGNPGDWQPNIDALNHGGSSWYANAANAIAEWKYVGYGFRFWSRPGGTIEISLDGVVVSAACVPAGGVGGASAVAFTKADVPYDEHRVKIREVAGTIYADAIEVMR